MAREAQSVAGGVFILIAILIGTTVGAIKGQPSIGLIAGAGVGVVIAILVWLRDRIRIGH